MLKVHNRKTLAVSVALAVAIVGVLNFVSRDLFFRLDLTDNHMYSLSESSKRVVAKLEDRLTMKVYFSDNLPGEYGNNRRYLQDLLEEYEAYSRGRIQFEFYRPESDAKLQEEARKYGIQPVQLQVIENDKLEVKRVYMGMAFLYGDEREALPVIRTTTGLEYDITIQIKKLVDREKRSIAFAEIGHQHNENNTVAQVLEESYQVRKVRLDEEIPADLHLLLVNGVEDSISAVEMDHLKTFIGRGGNLFMAQGRISANLATQVGKPIRSNIFDFLANLGLRLEENLVLDRKCSQVTVEQTQGFFRINTQMQYPFFPVVQRFGNHLVVKGLEQVQVLYPSEISLGGASGSNGTRSVVPLLTTSEKSGVVTGYYNLNPIQNPSLGRLNQPGKVVGALAISDSTGSASQVLLVSDSRFFEDSGAGGSRENHVFIANAVDFLMGERDLVALRSREVTARPLPDLEDAVKARLKLANIILPPVLIIGWGIFMWRRRINRAKALEGMYG